jgi:endonuclease YncB( thermonuclease family)
VRVLALIVLLPALMSARVLAAAEPETLTGPARVIDGDTFAIGTTVVRVADVDAPEMAQRCDDGPSALRYCGAYVADALKERIGGREVRCAVRELDQYDRRISTCEVAGEDLASWLISEGLAVANRPFSDRLIPDEEAARAAGRGIWQTSFEAPWDYRAHRWEVAVQEAKDAPSRGTSTAMGNGSTIPRGGHSGMNEPRLAPTRASAGSVRSARPWTLAGGRR